MKDKMKQRVYFKIGNGQYVSAWYDRWCAIGPLNQFITTRMIYDARLQNDSKVASLVQRGNWCWPDDWIIKFPALRQIQIPKLDEEISDKALLVTRTGQMTEYNTKTVWRDMDCDNPKVIWRHLIWFAQCILMHSFVLWMAMQNRLMTQDRVAVWKPNEPMKCVLCALCPY
ncbi:reverse transcriptase zinc-binding domain-containing protein [Tanacetum coccineum]